MSTNFAAKNRDDGEIYYDIKTLSENFLMCGLELFYRLQEDNRFNKYIIKAFGIYDDNEQHRDMYLLPMRIAVGFLIANEDLLKAEVQSLIVLETIPKNVEMFFAPDKSSLQDFNIEEKEKEINRLKEEILRKEIDLKREKIIAQEEIIQLKEKIYKEKEEIFKLKSRDLTFQELSLKAKERTKALEEDVRRLNKEIKELKEIVRVKEEEILKLNNIKSALEEENEKLTAQIQTLKEKISTNTKENRFSKKEIKEILDS